MQSGRTTFLSLATPVCVVLVYVVAFLTPWGHPVPDLSAKLTAEQAGSVWQESKSLFADGKYEEALPGVLRLHESFPGNHIYLEMAAEIYGRLGRYPQESEFWEMYLDRAPDPSDACPALGQSYAKQNKDKEAISAYERCLARAPENSDFIFYLAHALEIDGQTDRAGELYERGLKIAPEYSDLQIGLARVRLRQGKAAEAKGPVLKFLQKSPDNVDALLVAGLIYMREGNLSKAKEYLEHGVKLSDGYLDFHAALARIAVDENNYPEAIRHYDRILRDHPDDESTRARRDALAGKQ
jgi:predicted Zn-dependent protease